MTADESGPDGGPPNHPGAISEEELAALPEVVIHKRRMPSTIWLVPIVAALVGGWLWYDAIQSQGPLITIRFPTAEGLQEGKTAIKRLAVEVGKVTTIELGEDGHSVVVTARMSPMVEDDLRAGTQFWAVRPRIGASGIEGLTTIVSGVFIGMAPGQGPPTLEFVGSEDPPVTGLEAEDLKLVLTSDDVGSLGPGSPILYHGKAIGEVEDTVFVDEGHHVDIHVRVEQRYRDLVTTDSRFWNMSGLRLSYTAEGVDLELASLATLAIGGVAMDTPEHSAGEAAPPGRRFPLWERRGQWNEPSRDQGIDYVLYFDDSVRGLGVDAPVAFRGYQVGHVIGIELVRDADTRELLVAVRMRIEPHRIRLMENVEDPTEEVARQEIERFIGEGFRASLATGSYLSGALYVAIERVEDAPPFVPRGRNQGLPDLPEFPTVRGGLSVLMAKVQELPFEEVGAMLTSLSGALQDTVESGAYDDMEQGLRVALTDLADITTKARAQFGQELDLLNTTLAEATTAFQGIQQTVDDLDGTIAQVDRTIELLRQIAAPEGPVVYGLEEALSEFSAVARSLRTLVDYLERHPEALIRGKPDGDS